MISSIALILNFLFVTTGLNHNLSAEKLQGAFTGQSQSVLLKDLDNKTVNFNDLMAPDTLIVVAFWATWCKPCIEELDAINDNLTVLPEFKKVKFYAVSVDDSRSVSRVTAFVRGKEWQFSVYKDQNQDLKRHFEMNNVPGMVFLKNSELIHKKTGYAPGDEFQLLEEIKRFSK